MVLKTFGKARRFTDSRCCTEATPSPTQTGYASRSFSMPTPGSDPAGRPSKSSTASTPPATTKEPSTRSGGSVTSTRRRAARVPRHRRRHHRLVRRDSWPGTTPAEPPTAESKANNLLQVLRRTAHGFTNPTNPTNFEARGLLVT